MISFSGYDDVIKRVYDSGNSHVFNHWDSLSDSEKKSLLADLAGIDFNLVKTLFSNKDAAAETNFNPAPFISIPRTDAEKKHFTEAEAAGIELIKKGKTAAFIVAGGQGSRLGYEGPKGKFPVGPVSKKTLFQIHGEKILKYSKKYGVSIPWLVMTSPGNHHETVEYFAEQNWFGLGKGNTFIFPQNMIPSLDINGKIILENKTSVFKNPDGHGGSLTALATSGALAMLAERGIEIISYFQVDNPLVKIIDPVFIGFHELRGADVSSKAMKKAYPEERVGVFVEFAGNRVGVVEYSDLPDDKAHERDAGSELLFSAGSIAIHLFGRKFVEQITSGEGAGLPFHIAQKKIKSFENGSVKEIDGLKYEKFVFDALPLTEKNVVFETLREDEFAPVKNPSGVDSAESARGLMCSLHRRWLEEREIKIPKRAKVIEIAPSAAVEAADIDRTLVLPDQDEILIG